MQRGRLLLGPALLARLSPLLFFPVLFLGFDLLFQGYDPAL
jgi:hypothetical protein